MDYVIQQLKNTHFFKFTRALLKIDQILGHKTNLYTFKRMEITQCLLSDNKRNTRNQYQRVNWKIPKNVTNSAHLNNAWVK